MKSILGISAFYHDSAACLLKDGKIIADDDEDSIHSISIPDAKKGSLLASLLGSEVKCENKLGRDMQP